MANEKDPLADALDKTQRHRRLTKCETIFADRPEVLESIRKAYARKLSYEQIANVLNQDETLTETIGDGAVRKYLQRVGDAK